MNGEMPYSSNTASNLQNVPITATAAVLASQYLMHYTERRVNLSQLISKRYVEGLRTCKESPSCSHSFTMTPSSNHADMCGVVGPLLASSYKPNNQLGTAVDLE